MEASKKIVREKSNDINKTIVFFFIVDTPDHSALPSAADEFPVHLGL